MADLDPKPAPTSTSASEEEDDEVFEIREWIDADGRELSSEVVSVKAAAEQVARLDLVGKLQRAQEEAQQQQTQGNSKTTSAGEAVEEEEGPVAAAQQQQQQQLLDAHDWAGIKARADELEREEARVRSEEAAKEEDARRGWDKLEGGGWGKGFLNNGSGSGGGKGGGGGSSGSGSNEAAKAKQAADAPAPAAATRTTTRSALSSPEKRKLAGERPRKRVSFQLDAEAAARDAVGGARELGPFDDYQRLLQQHKQLRTRGWGFGGARDEEQEECKDEAKRQPRPPPPPVAFSGRVGERGAEAAEATGAAAGTAASMPAAPSAAGPEAGVPAAAAVAAAVIPPGMSRFKARALGLLPSESN